MSKHKLILVALQNKTNKKNVLGQCLDTLIIGHNCCSMLSLLNELINITNGIAHFRDK